MFMLTSIKQSKNGQQSGGQSQRQAVPAGRQSQTEARGQAGTRARGKRWGSGCPYVLRYGKPESTLWTKRPFDAAREKAWNVSGLTL